MKNQLLDIRAALLYLLYFQISENTGFEHEPESHKIDRQTQLWGIEQSLKELDYPEPQNIVYDNEGIPQVQWKNEAFEVELFYSFIEYNPDYFKVTQ